MDLIRHILWNISQAISTPPIIFILIGLSMYLYSKNRNTVVMQKMICGGSVNSEIELTLSQIVLGIVSGILISVMLGILGITFVKDSSIIFLLYISILLTFIKPRLICFSYSGAILGVLSIFIKTLNSLGISFEFQNYFIVDIPQLVAFIGIMHIVEGFLVMIDGHRGAMPVFSEKNGKILGGYSLKRYWIVPISLITTLTSNSYYMLGNKINDIPEWWSNMPFINGTTLAAIVGIVIFNMIGIIGYSSVTFTRSKREKAISSGISILIFGIILTILSGIIKLAIIGDIFLVIFMPLAHEFMLKIQTKEEQKRSPKYVSSNKGLTVLEIASESIFNEFGIDIGNRLVSINGIEINSEPEIYSILKENLYSAVFKIIDNSGKINEIKFRHKKNTRLGLVLVPKHVKKEQVIEVNNESFNNILEEIRKKHNKN